MPPPDWFSWELWAKAIYAVLSGPRLLATWMWEGYVGNRDNLVPMATFLGAVTIAWAALKQARTASLRHHEQTRADRERRITESFAKAVEQLGSDKLETRLGGIYTLERIAGESEREYWPIIETLTAFVRERAPWPSRRERVPWPPGQAEQSKDVTERRPPTDIQAVLTVLGRRDKTAPKQFREERRRLDLAATDFRVADLGGANLQGADLRGANLQGANLFNAHLQGAQLREAHLEGASIMGAHLERASMMGAHLQGAWLVGAHLQEANLREAHLQGAKLTGANLEGYHVFGGWLAGAHLEGADLSGVVGLTQGRLAKAFGDEKTQVADELRPPHWPPAATPEGAGQP